MSFVLSLCLTLLPLLPSPPQIAPPAFPPPVAASAPNLSDLPTITPAMRAADPRLNQLVTLDADNIILGELLAKLTAQTGVDCAADNRDTSSGLHLCVHLQHVPLGDALDSLWSLVSYRYAQWEWTRRGTAPAFSYRLYQSQAAKQQGPLLQKLVQETFEQEIETLVAASTMIEAERIKLVKQQPLLKYILEFNDDQWLMAHEFAQLTSIQRRRALRGEQEEISLAALTDKGRAYAAKALDHATVTMVKDGQTITAQPKAESIMFEFSRGRKEIYPHLMFMIKDDMNGARGMSLAPSEGPCDAFRDLIVTRWLLPGDSKTDAREKSALHVDKTDKAGQEAEALINTPFANRRTMDFDRRLAITGMERTAPIRRLALLSRSVPASVLAIVPPPHDREDSLMQRQFEGVLLSDYLETLWKYAPEIPHKWRNGVLLLNHLHYFASDERDAPYDLVVQLRRELRENGWLSLSTLGQVALLAPVQIDSLAEIVPTADVRLVQPLMALLATQPDIQGGGIALTDTLAAYLKTLPYPDISKTLDSGKAVRLRVRVYTPQDKPELPPDTHDISFELLDADGNVLLPFGFFQKRYVPGANSSPAR